MTQSVAAVKVWHILVAIGVFAGIVIAWNIFTYDNIVESTSGEKFIRKSYFKPLKKEKALAVANKAVEEKAKK